MCKIKVVLVTDNLDYGGSQRLIVDLAKRIDHDAFDVKVCATTSGGELLEAELITAGVDYRILNKPLKMDMFFPLRVRSLFSEWQPQIVHTFRFTANTFGRIGAMLARVPVIIGTEHVLEQKQLTLRLIDRVLARFSACVVVTTKEISAQVHSEHGLPYRRIRIIDECIDLDRFPFVERCLATTGTKLKKPLFKVGIVGRLVPQKGYWIFLDAIRQARKLRPEIKGIVVGDGELRQQLSQWVLDHQMEGGIEFWGFREDLPLVFREFDLFVMSSLREAMPLVLLAAAASGLPFACTAVGGIPEAFQDGIHGRLVPSGNSAALANAIVWSLDNYQAACAMAKTASQLVHDRHGLQAMVRLHEAMYQQLLGGHVKQRKLFYDQG